MFLRASRRDSSLRVDTANLMALNLPAAISVDGTFSGSSRGEVSRLFPRERSVAMVAAVTFTAHRSSAGMWWRWWVGRSGRSAIPTGTAADAYAAHATNASASNTTHTAAALGGARHGCAAGQCKLPSLAPAHRG